MDINLLIRTYMYAFANTHTPTLYIVQTIVVYIPLCVCVWECVFFINFALSLCEGSKHEMGVSFSVCIFAILYYCPEIFTICLLPVLLFLDITIFYTISKIKQKK